MPLWLVKATLQITFFEPNDKWIGKGIKEPVPTEVMITYEPSNDGTKFTTKVIGKPKGFFKQAGNLVATEFENGIADDGQRLNALLEKS